MKKCLENPNVDNDLMSLLITPIQRVPRYTLLLERVKDFIPQNHYEHLNLCKAIDEISEIASIVNSRKKDEENTVRLKQYSLEVSFLIIYCRVKLKQSVNPWIINVKD